MMTGSREPKILKRKICHFHHTSHIVCSGKKKWMSHSIGYDKIYAKTADLISLDSNINEEIFSS
jgi:hypothetical protein